MNIAILVLSIVIGALLAIIGLLMISKTDNPYNLKPTDHCPVQIEGETINGKQFYFRARGCQITFQIWPYGVLGSMPYDFVKALDYGTDHEAGHITYTDAIRLCTFWLNEYYELQTQKDATDTRQGF